jgi:hypothetical protein
MKRIHQHILEANHQRLNVETPPLLAKFDRPDHCGWVTKWTRLRYHVHLPSRMVKNHMKYWWYCKTVDSVLAWGDVCEYNYFHFIGRKRALCIKFCACK